MVSLDIAKSGLDLMSLRSSIVNVIVIIALFILETPSPVSLLDSVEGGFIAGSLNT